MDKTFRNLEIKSITLLPKVHLKIFRNTSEVSILQLVLVYSPQRFYNSLVSANKVEHRPSLAAKNAETNERADGRDFSLRASKFSEPNNHLPQG